MFAFIRFARVAALGSVVAALAAFGCALPVEAQTDDGRAFDALADAQKYCVQFTPNDVVKKDSATTSRVYGKPNYWTYFITAKEAGFTTGAVSGPYYCLHYAARVGWHDVNGSAVSPPPPVIPTSLNPSSTLADAKLFCGNDAVVWLMPAMSALHTKLTNGAEHNVWYVAQGEAGFGDPGFYQRQAQDPPNTYGCKSKMGSATQDYDAYEAMMANAAKNQASAAALTIHTTVAPQGGSVSGLVFMSANKTDAWVFPKGTPLLPTLDPSGKLVSLSVAGVVFAVNGIVAQGGGNIVAQGGGNLIGPNGAQIVAAGGGNIVAQGGGNIVAQGGGNIVAQGGGNFVGSNVISNDGGSFAIGLASLIGQDGMGLIAKQAAAIITNDGGGLLDLARASAFNVSDVSSMLANNASYFSAGMREVADLGHVTVYHAPGDVPANLKASCAIVFALKNKTYATPKAPAAAILGYACQSAVVAAGWTRKTY